MHQPTQRMMPVTTDDRRTATMTAVASALVGFGVAYLLLLTQPTLAARATTFVRTELLPAGAHWLAPIAIAGVAIGASGLGIFALRGFVVGVRRSPYLWLAPLLVGLSATVLLGAHAAMPLQGVSTLAFTVPALLLALAGGALYQAPGRGLKLTGVLLWVTPVLLLALAYLSRAGGVPSAITLSQPEQFFVFMVLVTWIALAAIALLVPEPHGGRSGRAEQMIGALRASLSDAESRAGQNVAELAALSNEKARLEQALAQAELQLQQAELGIGGRRRGLPWPATFALGLCIVGGLGVAAYYGVHRPVERKLEAALALAAQSDEAQQGALDAMRTQLSTERAQLEAERAKVAAALEQSKQDGEALQACEAKLPAEEGQGEVSAEAAPAPPAVKKAAARKAAPKARAKKTTAKRRAAPARAASNKPDELTAGGDDPIAGLE